MVSDQRGVEGMLSAHVDRKTEEDRRAELAGHRSEYVVQGAEFLAQGKPEMSLIFDRLDWIYGRGSEIVPLRLEKVESFRKEIGNLREAVKKIEDERDRKRSYKEIELLVDYVSGILLQEIEDDLEIVAEVQIETKEREAAPGQRERWLSNVGNVLSIMRLVAPLHEDKEKRRGVISQMDALAEKYETYRKEPMAGRFEKVFEDRMMGWGYFNILAAFFSGILDMAPGTGRLKKYFGDQLDSFYKDWEELEDLVKKMDEGDVKNKYRQRLTTEWGKCVGVSEDELNGMVTELASLLDNEEENDAGRFFPEAEGRTESRDWEERVRILGQKIQAIPKGSFMKGALKEWWEYLEKEAEARQAYKELTEKNLLSNEGQWLETLGLTPGVSFTEIKSAFKQMSLESHPDRNPDDPGAEERFKVINEAYQGLRVLDRLKQKDVDG